MSIPERPADVCIFRQPWWIEALAGDNPHGIIKVELTPEKRADLPYIIRKRYGIRIVTMPPLTQNAGPLTHGFAYQDNRQLGFEKDLYGALIDALPPHDAFNQNFHWSVGNWLPFHWRGFEQSTRYTYRLEDISNEEKLWSGLMSNIRREIKKARNRFEVRIHSDYDIDRFLDLNEMTFQRQGKALPYGREQVRQLDRACAERNCRKIFFAEDEEGKIHAALYIVWDAHSAYYLMGGGDPALRKSGATSLAIWEAILFSATVSRSFDFEGSMIEPVERFFRAFGARQTPYMHVWKFNSRLLSAAWSLVR